MIDYVFRPLESWPVPFTSHRRNAPFRAGYMRTLQDLERELSHLGSKQCIIQAAVTEDELRLDGRLRADARPKHPGVVVAFSSKHGPLSYPCDTYTDWQANLRAIALAMAALRAVDRYGVTRRGEQYRGWKQLPPGSAPGITPVSEMTAVAAARLLVAYGSGNVEAVLADPEAARAAYRHAAKKLHPDLHGSQYAQKFAELNTVKEIIDRHHAAKGGA